MAPKRSWLRINRTGSFSFAEILLETLFVLIVVTELSRECGKASFPGWQRTRVEPTNRLRYIEIVTGIRQDRMSTPPDPIDGNNQPSLPDIRVGSILLLTATATLYVSFAAFLFVNRDWKPPVISLADKSTSESCRIFSVVIWQAFAMSGLCTITFVNSMGWWIGKKIIMNFLVISLLGMWVAIVLICGLICGIPREFVDSNKQAKEGSSSVPYMAAARMDPETRSTCVRVVEWIHIVACVLVLIIGGLLLLCLVCVFYVATAVVLSLSPMMSSFIAVGILRGAVAVFGEAAALPGLIVVCCLLLIHSIGRLMGIWLVDGNVSWIVKKVLKFRSLKKNVDAADAPSKTVAFKFDTRSTSSKERVNVNSVRSTTYLVKLLLDGMVVCVIASALWYLYVGGTTRNPDDADPWLVLTTGNLPQCFLTTMATLFDTPMDHNQTSTFMNYPYSAVESKAMDASFVVSGLLIVPSILSVTALGTCLLCLKLLRCCCGGSKKTTPSDSGEAVPSTNFYNFHCGLGAFPLYFVKIILPLYALDLLPGNWYIPGIAVYLVGCALHFYWKLMKVLVAGLSKMCKEDSIEDPCKEKDELIWTEPRKKTILSFAVVSRKCGVCNSAVDDAKPTAPLIST